MERNDRRSSMRRKSAGRHGIMARKKRKRKIIRIILTVLVLVVVAAVQIYPGIKRQVQRYFDKNAVQVCETYLNEWELLLNKKEAVRTQECSRNQNDPGSGLKSEYEAEYRFKEESGNDSEKKSGLEAEQTTDYDKLSASYMIEKSVTERLILLSEKDSRIKDILAQSELYPEDILSMLSRNIDMLDFVLDYPEKIGKVYGKDIGTVEKGIIPRLLQWDERWGYAYYGNDPIAVDGCGPTALSMVIGGLTGDNTVTPYVLAKFAENNGYYVSGSGSSWLLMKGAAEHYGIGCEEMVLDKNQIFRTLTEEKPIICAMGAGDFTIAGHFIVLTGVEEGKIRIHDPNSVKRSEVLWEYERIALQIKNLWKFWI